jgi:hypothetical protein
MDEKKPSDTPHFIFVYWGQLSMENVSPSKQGR